AGLDAVRVAEDQVQPAAACPVHAGLRQPYAVGRPPRVGLGVLLVDVQHGNPRSRPTGDTDERAGIAAPQRLQLVGATRRILEAVAAREWLLVGLAWEAGIIQPRKLHRAAQRQYRRQLDHAPPPAARRSQSRSDLMNPGQSSSFIGASLKSCFVSLRPRRLS